MTETHEQMRQQGDAEIERKQHRRHQHDRNLAIAPRLDHIGAFQQAQRPHEDVGGGDQTRVALADVYELVGDYGRQFIIVQSVDQSPREHRHRKSACDAAGESVHRPAFDDADIGRFEPGRDRQRFDEPAEAGLIGVVDEAERNIPPHGVHVQPHLGEEIAGRDEGHEGRVPDRVARPIIPRRVCGIDVYKWKEQHHHRHRL